MCALGMRLRMGGGCAPWASITRSAGRPFVSFGDRDSYSVKRECDRWFAIDYIALATF